MDRKKILLYTQAVLCTLWVILMAVAAIRIYTEGVAYQAQGHPEVWIYTREKAIEAILTYLPVLVLCIAVTILGAVRGIRDEEQDKPVPDKDIIDMYKAERETTRDPEAEIQKARTLRIAKIAVLVIAIVFVIAGISNGSMEDMFFKAVNICTECVGLG